MDLSGALFGIQRLIKKRGADMALTKLTQDLNYISALDDEPNDVGGMSASALKAAFDAAANDIKT